MKITGYAKILADYMSTLSEKYYSDEWMVQLEYELWRDTIEEPELLSPEEVEKLKTHTDNAEGWVRMDYDSNKLEFMSLKAWKTHYKGNRPF